MLHERRRRREATLLRTAGMAVLFTSFIVTTYGFGVYLFGAIAPTMRQEIPMSYGIIGIVTALAQVGFLAAALSSDAIAMRLGAARLVHLSVLVSGICMISLSWVQGPLLAAALLTVAGACAATVWTPMVRIMAGEIPERHRGKVMGLIASGTSYGVFFNGLLIRYVMIDHGWRVLWALVGGLALIACLVSTVTLWDMLREDSPQTVSGDKTLRKIRRWPGREASIVWALLFFAGFVCVPFQTYMVPFMEEDLGYATALSGNAYAASGLAGMAGGFLFGALADRSSIPFALRVAFLVVLASVGLFVMATDIVLILVASVMFGLVFQAIFGLIPAHISKTFPPDNTIWIFGVGNVMLGGSSILGNFLGGWIKELTGSFTSLYLGMVALMLVVLALTRWLTVTPRTPS